MEKTGYDQIQDLRRGSHSVNDDGNAGVRAGSYQEPGAYAFYHPDADVLNARRPSPGETAGAMASVRFGSSDAYASMDGDVNTSSCAKRYRSYDPGSGTFLGYDGTRHACE